MISGFDGARLIELLYSGARWPEKALRLSRG